MERSEVMSLCDHTVKEAETYSLGPFHMQHLDPACFISDNVTQRLPRITGNMRVGCQGGIKIVLPSSHPATHVPEERSGVPVIKMNMGGKNTVALNITDSQHMPQGDDSTTIAAQ